MFAWPSSPSVPARMELALDGSSQRKHRRRVAGIRLYPVASRPLLARAPEPLGRLMMGDGPQSLSCAPTLAGEDLRTLEDGSEDRRSALMRCACGISH